MTARRSAGQPSAASAFHRNPKAAWSIRATVGCLWARRRPESGASMLAPTARWQAGSSPGSIESSLFPTSRAGLAPEGADGGYLIASSQGDNAFALYRLPNMAPSGHFRIARGKRLGRGDRWDCPRAWRLRPRLSGRPVRRPGRQEPAQGAEFQAGALGDSRGSRKPALVQIGRAMPFADEGRVILHLAADRRPRWTAGLAATSSTQRLKCL